MDRSVPVVDGGDLSAASQKPFMNLRAEGPREGQYRLDSPANESFAKAQVPVFLAGLCHGSRVEEKYNTLSAHGLSSWDRFVF